MKKGLLSFLSIMLSLMVLSGCATPEERAARAAEQVANVKAALTARNYRIAVSRMYPRSGASKNVSYQERLAVFVSAVFRTCL